MVIDRDELCRKLQAEIDRHTVTENGLEMAGCEMAIEALTVLLTAYQMRRHDLAGGDASVPK